MMAMMIINNNLAMMWAVKEALHVEKFWLFSITLSAALTLRPCTFVLNCFQLMFYLLLFVIILNVDVNNSSFCDCERQESPIINDI